MSSATAVQAREAAKTSGTATGPEREALEAAVIGGLSAKPYTLPAWLFYDRRGSELFESITELPEYYLTRTERGLFAQHADEMLACAAGDRSVELAFVELGAGTATKTGLLLQAAVRRQGHALYVPVDVSESALAEAEHLLTCSITGLSVEPVVANYLEGEIRMRRPAGCVVVALYIGSSLGNFDPAEARALLRHLRSQLRSGDALLLGTDLPPGPSKSVAALVAAYDDAAGVTAAFNLNILERLNRDLGAGFMPDAFRHEARWNAAESRIEMHLVADQATTVSIPLTGGPLGLTLRAGESLHTENSYKYTEAAVRELLEQGGLSAEQRWTDEQQMFAVTLARVV